MNLLKEYLKMKEQTKKLEDVITALRNMEIEQPNKALMLNYLNRLYDVYYFLLAKLNDLEAMANE